MSGALSAGACRGIYSELVERNLDLPLAIGAPGMTAAIRDDAESELDALVDMANECQELLNLATDVLTKKDQPKKKYDDGCDMDIPGQAMVAPPTPESTR